MYAASISQGERAPALPEFSPVPAPSVPEKRVGPPFSEHLERSLQENSPRTASDAAGLDARPRLDAARDEATTEARDVSGDLKNEQRRSDEARADRRRGEPVREGAKAEGEEKVSEKGLEKKSVLEGGVDGALRLHDVAHVASKKTEAPVAKAVKGEGEATKEVAQTVKSPKMEISPSLAMAQASANFRLQRNAEGETSGDRNGTAKVEMKKTVAKTAVETTNVKVDAQAAGAKSAEAHGRKDGASPETAMDGEKKNAPVDAGRNAKANQALNRVEAAFEKAAPVAEKVSVAKTATAEDRKEVADSKKVDGAKKRVEVPVASQSPVNAEAVSSVAVKAANDAQSAENQGVSLKKEGGRAEAAPGLHGTQSASETRTKAPTAAAPAAAMRPLEVMHQVAAQIRTAVVNGRSEMTVRMSPEHLGPLTIRLSSDDAGATTGQLTVETKAVKEILDSQMADLKEHMRLLGHEFASLTVDVASQGSSQAHADAGKEGFAGSETSGRGGREDRGEKSDKNVEHVSFAYSNRVVNLVA